MAWLTGWTHREKLTIQHANVDSALTDFPVCVKLSADADYSDALATGADIRFTDSDGETLLKHEMESWSGGGGSNVTADFWVKLPSISAVAGTDFYIYWEKAGAADGQDAANVWDANFIGVWHFAGNANDSSGNGYHASLGGTTAYAAGRIGQCLSMVEGYIEPSIPKTSIGTIEMAFYLDNLSDWQQLYGVTSGGNDFEGWVRYYTPAGLLQTRNKESTHTCSANTWYQFAYKYDQVADSSYGNGSIWIDGQDVTGANYSANQFGSGNLFFGQDSAAHAEQFQGDMDEIRVSDIMRSDAWIKFTHYNIAEADNELTWGGKETVAAAGRKAPILGGGIGLGV